MLKSFQKAVLFYSFLHDVLYSCKLQCIQLSGEEYIMMILCITPHTKNADSFLQCRVPFFSILGTLHVIAPTNCGGSFLHGGTVVCVHF